MRVVAQMAFITTLALGLAGCYHFIAPPDMATAAVYGPSVPIRSLSPQQMARLSGWIKAHDAGWRDLMETPPAPSTITIVMRESNGQQSYVNLFESKDGAAMAYFYPPRPASPLERYLPEADVAALWEIVRN
jgi:hypothetical protein